MKKLTLILLSKMTVLSLLMYSVVGTSQSLAPSLTMMENLQTDAEFEELVDLYKLVDSVPGALFTPSDITATKEAFSGKSKSESKAMKIAFLKGALAVGISNGTLTDKDQKLILKTITKLENQNKTTFFMYGEGNLRDKIIDGDEDANVAGGSIGVAFQKGKTSLGLTFNLADPTDSTSVEGSFFSEALISPMLQNSSFMLQLEHFIGSKNNVFASLDLLGSSGKWFLGDQNLNSGVFSASLKINWIPYYIEADEIGSARLWFDFGFTVRSIFSDVAKEKYDDLRTSSFTTEKKTFYGTELGINLQVGKTMYYAKLPWLIGTEAADIDGLTGPRLVIGAKVTADFLKIVK